MAQAEIRVRLTPRSDRDELVGMREGVLLARVTAPPVDGRANRALCALMAKRMRVAPSRVEVVRGARGRDKLVRVEGLRMEELLAALGSGAPRPR